MQKFTVALDCDEVLNNLIEKTLELYNTRHGTGLTADIFTQYDFYKCLPFEIAEELTSIFMEKELWDSLSPAPDSQWGVKKLIDNGYDVYVATATHYSNFAWKVDWFAKNFPFIDQKHIICIQNKSLLHVDVLVDDCAENLMATNYAVDRVLLDKPWNRNVHDDVYGIYRTNNWEEIVEYVNELYKDAKGLYLMEGC